MKKQYISFLTVVLLLAACAGGKRAVNGSLSPGSLSVANGGKVWASLYQQRAAEYQALCFQAYNVAKLRLDEALPHKGARPLAVVTDIDETLLDNSPYDAQRAIRNQEYDAATWKQWTAKAQCDTVPGASAFFKYAASKGVTVFYVTNRDEDERTGTLKNLRLYQLPFADDAHLLLKNGPSSKESRRQQVLKNYEIVLLCGDNLPDFDVLYDNRPAEANRTQTTQQLMRQFGSKYIVIPNPSYGDFEGALFNFNYKLTPAQKDSVIKAKIKLGDQ
jgi:5'-nucleotidase (lipoprotein e(P4) family)